MNYPLIAAWLLSTAAFFIHSFVGDGELKILFPEGKGEDALRARSIWTMGRAGWHWVSVDLLCASLIAGLSLFTEMIPQQEVVLGLAGLYFFVQGLVWIMVLAISPPFAGRWLKLGQWILLWVIAAFLVWARVW
ncbi:MAG: hypothetical protein AAF804_03490 [Bacteroidota bacterium]